MAELSDKDIAQMALRRVFEDNSRNAALAELAKTTPEWQLLVSNTARTTHRLRTASDRQAQARISERMIKGTIEMMLATPAEQKQKLDYILEGQPTGAPPAVGKQYSEEAGLLAQLIVKEITTLLDIGKSGPGSGVGVG
jgi:hypothetical protein